ncbi:hypothetical protein D3C79_1049270 [compost metagenome]
MLDPCVMSIYSATQVPGEMVNMFIRPMSSMATPPVTEGVASVHTHGDPVADKPRPALKVVK